MSVGRPRRHSSRPSQRRSWRRLERSARARWRCVCWTESRRCTRPTGPGKTSVARRFWTETPGPSLRWTTPWRKAMCVCVPAAPAAAAVPACCFRGHFSLLSAHLPRCGDSRGATRLLGCNRQKVIRPITQQGAFCCGPDYLLSIASEKSGAPTCAHTWSYLHLALVLDSVQG